GFVDAAAFMTIPVSNFLGTCLTAFLISETGDCLLYSASIFATGVINSPSDLTIVVNANPITGLDGSDLTRQLAMDFEPNGPNSLKLKNDFPIGSFTLNFGQPYSVDITFETEAFTAVPEPSTLILLNTGLIGLLGYHWQRKKHAA